MKNSIAPFPDEVCPCSELTLARGLVNIEDAMGSLQKVKFTAPAGKENSEIPLLVI